MMPDTFENGNIVQVPSLQDYELLEQISLKHKLYHSAKLLYLHGYWTIDRNGRMLLHNF